MFRFRLQQVLDLRQQQERELASQLVQALNAHAELENELNSLQAKRDSSAAHNGGMRSVGELSNLAFILQQLDGCIESASDAVAAAGETVTQTKDALTSAHQDRRVLDRLRDRHEEDHRTAAEQTDRRTMDDIALSRFTQSDSE